MDLQETTNPDPDDKSGEVVPVAVETQAAPDPLEKILSRINEIQERMTTHEGKIEQIFTRQDEHDKREASQHRVKHYRKFRDIAEEKQRATPVAIKRKHGFRFAR